MAIMIYYFILLHFHNASSTVRFASAETFVYGLI